MRLRISLIARVVGALVTICGAVASAAPNPYTIDVIINETGANAFTGQTEMQAIQLYEKLANSQGGINGTPVHFQFYDDETDPKIAIQLANQVLANHPAVILGSGQTATCAAIAPLMENGPVDYCFTSGYTPKSRGYVFSANAGLHYIVPANFQFALGKGWTRVGWVTTTVASGQAADEEQKYAMSLPQYRSMKIVSFESFNPTDLSVNAQVTRLKEANPQVVMTPASGPGFALLMRTMHDAGLNVPVIASSANLHPEQLKPLAAILPAQLYFNGLIYYARDTLKPGPLRSAMDTFFAAYKASGETLTPDSGQGWDPPLIIVSALRKLGTNATAQQLRDYILNLHDFAGVNGMYDFRGGDPHGLDQNAIIFVQWNATTNDFKNVTKPGGAPL
jgi:branched-chain amino acid transport system substrate-binding protein